MNLWQSKAACVLVLSALGTGLALAQDGAHGGHADPARAAATPMRQPAGSMAAPTPQAQSGGWQGRRRGAGDGAPRRAARDDVLWLGDQPPERALGDGGAGHGGHGGSRSGMAEMMGDGRSTPVRKLWLLQGQAQVPLQGPALLLGPQGEAATLDAAPPGSAHSLELPLPEPGYYNLYAVQQALAQDTLVVQAAKAVLARPAGHGRRNNEVEHQTRIDARVPIEILRQPKEGEGLFTRLNYGDALVFQVLLQGQPAAGAIVSLTTGQGWRNTQVADAEGKARFTLIRDYFPPSWSLFERTHRETYLLSATVQQEQSGAWQGQPYSRVRHVATLSESYYPSISDYKSYAWGLGLSLGLMTLTGLAIYLYRRRRVKPYREEVFRD